MSYFLSLKPCSEAWAFAKAQAWADTMKEPYKIIEFKRGKYDCVPNEYYTQKRIVGTVSPTKEDNISS
jgi:hypothetical protein